LLLALGTACSSSPSPPAKGSNESQTRAAARKPALALGELHDLVPAAGLRFLVEGAPRRIWDNPRLRGALGELLPDAKLDGFAVRTGVDLRKLENAVVAGFDMGTLYLGQCSESCGPRARDRFIERLAGREVVTQTDTEPVAASVKGTLDGEPVAFIDMGRVVGVASRDLTLARVPLAFALGKLKKTPPALRGAALSTLPDLGRERLVTFYAPGPFEGEWTQGLHGMLSAALALALYVEPVDDEYLRVTLVMSGDFSEGGQAALDELTRVFGEIAASSTGKLFAFERARSLRGSFNPQYLTLSTELPLSPLVSGLRAAVIADVWEILGLPKPDSASGRPE
jgi:hypothetical protein